MSRLMSRLAPVALAVGVVDIGGREVVGQHVAFRSFGGSIRTIGRQLGYVETELVALLRGRRPSAQRFGVGGGSRGAHDASPRPAAGLIENSRPIEDRPSACEIACRKLVPGRNVEGRQPCGAKAVADQLVELLRPIMGKGNELP